MYLKLAAATSFAGVLYNLLVTQQAGWVAAFAVLFLASCAVLGIYRR